MPDQVPWPPHAYVPGQSARHPETWFDAIKTTVTPGADMQHTRAWAVGLAYLEAGYFWECHEVLEAVWMALPNPSPERDVTQAVIQLANARLKHKMGRPRAVMRLCDKVDTLLARHSGVILGLDMHQIAEWTEETRSEVK